MAIRFLTAILNFDVYFQKKLNFCVTDNLKFRFAYPVRKTRDAHH